MYGVNLYIGVIEECIIIIDFICVIEKISWKNFNDLISSLCNFDCVRNY